MNNRTMFPLLIAGIVLASIPTAAIANEKYPSRPIKMIVPFPAGGVTDTLARMIGEKLSGKWGQPVIVDNRSGASGNIGAEAVARADPDGYTLLVTPPPPLAINQSLFPKLSFDPTAFVPVTVIATIPNVLVAHSDLPASNVHDLIALARANPDKLSYGSTGSGGTPHITTEMLKHVGSVRIVHVPYRGMALMPDLLAGRIDFAFLNISDVLPHIRAGRLKALVVASRERSPAIPDVPTMAEIFPGFVSVTWFAVAAPPKTSPEIAAKLSTAIAKTLRSPVIAQRLNDLHAIPVGSSPVETAAFIDEESRRWREVILTAGIKVD
jgi:tripartite-type tricarboxylate transporter receptor subunit TctC